MSKRQSHKSQTGNRVGTLSIGQEAPNQVEEQVASALSQEFSPSYEEIQKKAYQIHEEKGGSELENWLEAERELKELHKTI